MSKAHTFDTVFMLLGGFFFYCVVKCKPASLYVSACCAAEVSSASINILAFWRGACHVYPSLELVCWVVPRFFDRSCGCCKGICEVFCQQLSVFFKVSYLFGAPFEGTFFSLNKELQKQINQQTCGCLNYSLQLQSSNCKYTATSTTVL